MTTSHSVQFDIFIIGGGIFGSSIASDCAGRGLSVGICDQQDLCGDDSTHSIKLFHCGFHYLENMDLFHVASSLKERNALLKNARHLNHPIDLIIPYAPDIRSRLKVKAGLFIYGKLGANQLKKPTAISLKHTTYGEPLSSRQKKAMLCQESIVDDSRLALENLLIANEKGAALLPRTRLISGYQEQGIWHLALEDSMTGDKINVTTQCLVNAAGSWADQVTQTNLGCHTRCQVPLERSNYILVPKLYEGSHGYLIQHPDRSFITVIPYLDNFSLIGPTRQTVEGPSLCDKVEPDQIQSLVDTANDFFKQQITASDVTWSFSTINPLSNTADVAPHVLDLQCSDGKAALVNVFSGKMTTHRILAEQVIEMLLPYLPASEKTRTPWTQNRLFPGGDFGAQGFDGFILSLNDQFPWLPPHLFKRYCSTYGARAPQLLYGASSIDDLGKRITHDLYERELNWLIEKEWATTANDILWRRTKLGLTISEIEKAALNDWIEQHHPYRAAVADYLNNHSLRTAAI